MKLNAFKWNKKRGLNKQTQYLGSKSLNQKKKNKEKKRVCPF